MTTFRVLGSDGDAFCRLLGQDDLRRRALEIAGEHHAKGEDVQVWRVTDTGQEFIEASWRQGEDLIEY